MPEMTFAVILQVWRMMVSLVVYRNTGSMFHKGTVSREKLFNGALGEVNETITIDRARFSQFSHQLVKTVYDFHDSAAVSRLI